MLLDSGDNWRVGKIHLSSSLSSFYKHWIAYFHINSEPKCETKLWNACDCSCGQGMLWLAKFQVWVSVYTEQCQKVLDQSKFPPTSQRSTELGAPGFFISFYHWIYFLFYLPCLQRFPALENRNCRFHPDSCPSYSHLTSFSQAYKLLLEMSLQKKKMLVNKLSLKCSFMQTSWLQASSFLECFTVSLYTLTYLVSFFFFLK